MKGKGTKSQQLKGCEYSYKKETEQQLEPLSTYQVAAAIAAFCLYNSFQ